MSLVSGLLNWKCDVKRFTQQNDGQGGFSFGTPTLVTADLAMLKTAKQVVMSTPNEGRSFVEQTQAYFEYANNTVIKENDMLTNLRDGAGVVETEIVNGQAQPTVYKIKSVTDPNGEHDHLEADLEKVRGRGEDQP